MTGIDETQISCGVHQLYEIGRDTPKQSVAAAKEDFFYESDDWGSEAKLKKSCAFYIFSDTVSSGAGLKLAKYIRDNRLGTVQISRAKVNPNSGNTIQVFTWKVNDRALQRWTGK